jgi:hypothetical protein
MLIAAEICANYMQNKHCILIRGKKSGFEPGQQTYNLIILSAFNEWYILASVQFVKRKATKVILNSAPAFVM